MEWIVRDAILLATTSASSDVSLQFGKHSIFLALLFNSGRPERNDGSTELSVEAAKAMDSIIGI